ncbi:MAG TPA: SigB/SigF/SigG family RNA polymerase sigma factor [Ilumatobacteraceae bacterium]|jgi:RNA polymerase sigma-B factor|nr:SigB/SigF/SigG family RNA polymerase sigma factor [Ilumatobacteraceae bacterium]
MHGQSDSDEEWLLDSFDRYSTSRDPRLRDEIAERTLWLATRGARRFADRGEPLDDLVQVARIGLLNAIDRFDPSHGVPFGAYATPTIMGELRRYFRDHTWGVHVSRRAKDLRPAVNTATETLSKELLRSPRISEIAERMKIPEEAVIEALEANNAYRARPLDQSGNSTPAIDSNLDAVLNKQVIAGLLERLRPRQRQILHLRFFEELSQAQIAEQIGTSQVHVGRLLASSLAELRSHLREDPPGAV